MIEYEHKAWLLARGSLPSTLNDEMQGGCI